MDSDTIRKPTFIGRLPTDLFKVIQTYLSHKDYRNLMNSDIATFANTKYETAEYRFNPMKYHKFKILKYLGLKLNFYYNLINVKVKDKSKQISVSITSNSLMKVLPYFLGFRGIKELYLHNKDILDDFDFNLFNNIYKVVLRNFTGVENISSGFENVKELSISWFNDLQSIKNINTTKTLEAFYVKSCRNLNTLNFPLNNVVRLGLGKANPNFNLQTIERSKLKEFSTEFDEQIENVLLNPVDFASLQALSLHCHFPDSFHNFSLFENISDLGLCSKSDTSISLSRFNGKRLYFENFKVFGLIQNMSNDKASFSSVTELHFTDCHDFTEVPSLPGLIDLLLFSCNQLQSIPSLNKLQFLSIYECNELIFISPDQPKLKECWIKIANIEDVSFTVGCKELHLHSNNQVKNVSMLRRVKTLELNRCDGLTSLDGLSGDPFSPLPQRSMFLSHLINVHAFSLHHIFSLRLFQLPHLRSCKGIHHIEHLHIHKCDNFKSTSGLKHITRVLDISDCPRFNLLVDVEGIPLIRLKGNSRLRDYSAVQDEWTDCGVMDKGVQLFALNSMKEKMEEAGWQETIEELVESL